MPAWMQPVTWLNPIRHFGIIARAALMKGSGIDVLWPNFLALIGFTVRAGVAQHLAFPQTTWMKQT